MLEQIQKTKRPVVLTVNGKAEAVLLAAKEYEKIADDSTDNALNFVLQLEKKVYSLEDFPDRNPYIPENEFFGTDYRHL